MKRIATIAIIAFCAAARLTATESAPTEKPAGVKPTMERAAALIAAAKWAEAVAELEGVVKADASNGTAWLQLSRCRTELGEFDGAIAAANIALTIRFQPQIAHLAMARAQAGKGDRARALEQLEAVAAIGPNILIGQRVDAIKEFDFIRSDPRFVAARRGITPCGTPEYRQFDFWLGNWRVENLQGAFVGENDVTLHLDGCMLMESWRGGGGMSGMSMNYYDPASGTWNQLFVDNTGAPANWPPLKGKFEDGKMVLLSPEGATPRTRWTWTKVSDDKVRQVAEQSDDGGKTWKVTWDSFYIRKK